jgi:hypothetical protein
MGLPVRPAPVCFQRSRAVYCWTAPFGPHHRQSDTLASFHWLRAPQRVQFKLAVLTFRALHDLAPDYLSSELRRIADIPTRRRLRSAASGRLDVPPTHLKTVDDRAFSVAGPHLWNSLPDDIVNCQSLPAFRRKLKTHLFKQSYPDIIL